MAPTDQLPLPKVTSAEPAPRTKATISACILARNEERQIEDALKSLQGWTDEIIVIDNASEDRTVEVARRYAQRILSAPPALNFDAIRNLAIEAASSSWIFFLDADERVPPALGPRLRHLVEERGHEFEALIIPFRHYFCGKWIEHSGWWPGYTRPQLLKKGRFRYNERLHSGVNVDGRIVPFPADDPELTIAHYSYEDLSHYLEKLNRYTDGEAESLLADGAGHSWQAQLAHLVHDWQRYYEHKRGDLDGMHGFVLAFFSGVYRFLARAKLWNLRRQRGELMTPEPVPGSVREMLEFMARVALNGDEPWTGAPHPPVNRIGAPIPPEWHALTPERPSERAPGDAGRPGITACILARNEERRIEGALASLRGWADQILVIDNESTDATAAIAGRYADLVLSAPRRENFDGARNLAIEHATQDWIFFLDADERVPSRLGPHLRRLVAEHGEEFEALYLPFRNYFYGKWMQSSVWWPGYPGPRLLKKGAFHYEDQLHAGARVTGRSRHLPADDPELAILHFAYDDIGHYLGKLNHYTSGEAETLRSLNVSHCWQVQLGRFALDWQVHYDHGRAYQDGMHGFVQSFLCAFYRFVCHAKLWDLRRKRGEWAADEPVPADLREMLEFMARVLQEGPAAWQAALPAAAPRAVPLLWRGPLFDTSGFADEGRNFVLGLIEAGEQIAVAPEKWDDPDAGLDAAERALMEGRVVAPDTPSELCVLHTLLYLIKPVPTAAFNIARALFETDRLPEGVPERLNQMDRVWVPSEFHRETFLRSGVLAEKIAVIPEAIDAGRFLPGEAQNGDGRTGAERVEARWQVPGDEEFRFLAVFDWTLHKGWDVLVEAFALEFGDQRLATENTEGTEREKAVAGLKVGKLQVTENLEPSNLQTCDSEALSVTSVSSVAKHSSETRKPRSVGLVLKVWSSNGYTLEHMRNQVDAHLRARLGRSLAEFPNVHLWKETIPTRQMPDLYRSVDAFVLPTRGEGWCRPLMEAMASGLPTIATGWSGLTAFHDAEVGYPVRYRLQPVSAAGAREIPIYAGHCWAEPDVADLRRRMRQVVEDPEGALARGRAAQRSIAERFDRPCIARLLREELAQCRELAKQKQAASGARKEALPADEHDRAPAVAPNGRRPDTVAPLRSRPAAPLRPNANPVPIDPVSPVDFQSALGRPLRVRWEGDQAMVSSLALVNRELCLPMLAAGDVELTSPQIPHPWHWLSERDDPRYGPLFARFNATLSGPPDVTVRHHFPPNWEPVSEGKLVVMQPWELSHLPRRDWLEGALRHADELWAYSRFVRDIYVRSGVPAEKVRIVPLGVRPDVFQPEGPRYALPTRKEVRFLFVGGAVARKGIDLLLAAYRAAFTAADDVCLIVKDMGTRTFYQGQTLATTVRAAQADTTGPEVIYMDQDLTEPDMAALYRASTCLALPYRGEGFGLPPLEAMACGRPVIVTTGGPTDDYVDDRVALRLPHRRVVRTGLYNDDQATAWDPWELEPDLDALVAALRWVYEHPDEALRRGEQGRSVVLQGWNWERAAGIARQRLLAVCKTGVQSREGANGGHPAEAAARPEARLRFEPALPVRHDHPRPGGGHSATAPRERTVELSLCMIVRDEEPRIRQCLESIAPFVDEMVVVDTGSSDGTREVARDCGARVFDFPWPDSFAEARNQSLAQARGRWLFWMDADDVISPECGAKLRSLVRAHPGLDAAFQVQVHIPPGPGEFSPSVVDHVKLFPNRPELRFEHRIHEQILPALRRAGLDVQFTDVYVTHQHYDRSSEGQARKRLRDFRLLELDLADLPDHPFVLFNLGMTHLYATKEYEVAAHYLRRSLDRSDPRDSIVRKAYAMLAVARVCQGDWTAAAAAIEEGRAHYPEDAELLFHAGQVYQEVGRFDDARRALEQLVSGRDGNHYRSVDTGLRTYRGRHELARLHQRLGDAAHCEQVLRELWAEHPQYLPAQFELVETLYGMGRCEEAATLLARFEREPGNEVEMERLRLLIARPPTRLRGSAPAVANPTALIVEAHRQYEAANGPPGLAISLELALYLWSLLWERRPERILDLGAGFGSFIFRLFALQSGGNVTAWTVDDDPAWLAETREFLRAQELSISNLSTWGQFHEDAFDLVLHDLGDMDLRAATLDRVLSLARPGGVVVLDDTNRREYADHAARVLACRGLRYRSLETEATDGYGRYAWVVTTPPGMEGERRLQSRVANEI